MKKWIMMLVFCLLLVGTGVTAYAGSGVQVTDANNQTKVYEDVIQTLTINGEKKDLGKAPGIVIDNEVMLTHTAVFKKILGMKVTYNGKAGTVVLETKEHKMEFQTNQKTAILDGKEMPLSVAPVKAKYLDTGVNTILLPTKAIADVWGYQYEFDETNQSVSLHREGGMELMYAGLSYYYQKTPVTLLVNGEEIDTELPGFIVDDYNMVPAWKMAKELGIKYSYSKSKKSITLTYGSNKVIMTMNSKDATVNDESVMMPVEPVYIKDRSTGAGGNMVPGEFVAEQLGFGYEWDAVENSANFTTPQGLLDGYQIVIPLDEECTSGNYEVEDDYFNHKFKIKFTGEYESFYDVNLIENYSDAIKSISVEEDDFYTTITLKANKIKGYRIKEEDGILYVKVGTPQEIYDKIVVLDAGHGGTDPGAAGNGIYEKNCTLNIVNAAKDYFDMDESIKVYYTRTTNSQANMTSGSSGLNTSTSLRARTDLANEVDADLFISVHINSASNTSARGTEVYYSSNNNRKNDGGLTASKLAQLAYDNMVKAVGSSKRGVKTANFYVVRYTNMPAILIETAFISNKQDADILKSEKKVDQMGKAIYDSVVQAFSKYPTGR